jgi:hypothetical protein
MKPITTMVALGVTGVLGAGVSISAAVANDTANSRPERPSTVRLDPTPLPRVTAVVGRDGRVDRGLGLRSVRHSRKGVYVPRFNRNIKECTWVGSIGKPGFSGSEGPGFITITGRNGTNNGLYVTTFDVAGEPANRPFHIVVVCR